MSKAVEGLLKVAELALELGDLVNDGLGEGHEDVVNVEISMELGLVDIGLLDKESMFGGDGKEGAKQGCLKSRCKGAVEVNACGCLIAHCDDARLVLVGDTIFVGLDCVDKLGVDNLGILAGSWLRSTRTKTL